MIVSVDTSDDVDFTNASWLNQPRASRVTAQWVAITTEPRTDLWQRSYYGFKSDNAHCLLVESDDNFTFTTRASFDYRARFDQCGVVVYVDAAGWFKASVEHEEEGPARLGSVVTNLGHSDWATTDIEPATTMWYRLSRRGPDFMIESSPDGETFAQMRIFHLHCLGETSPEMGRLDPPAPAGRPVRFGLYACSPTDSSFVAMFDHFELGPCAWMAHRE